MSPARPSRPPRRLRLLALSALLAAGCSLGSPSGTSSPPRPSVPTATAVGTPLGSAAATTIGPGGGSLSAADGTWTLTVPPGAVASTTTFTATPLTSRAPGALTATVRLETDQPLAGPVKVTFKGLGAGNYPTGVSLKSLGIRFQDAQGFWVSPASVSYDVAADTVTAVTPHLSDWALVLGQTPALTGTFTLTQTVGIPFTASGTAALYAWDSASEPTYYVTGTLTLPDSLTSGTLTCVPDAVSKDLELSVAEVHDTNFRWGLNARWELTCTDSVTGAQSSQELATLFDTMQINLLSCGGDYVGAQVNDGASIQGSYAKDCGTSGVVSATWDFRTCWAGLSCQPAVCQTGTVACDGGVAACTPTGNAADGLACGSGGTCAAGACVGG